MVRFLRCWTRRASLPAHTTSLRPSKGEAGVWPVAGGSEGGAGTNRAGEGWPALRASTMLGIQAVAFVSRTPLYGWKVNGAVNSGRGAQDGGSRPVNNRNLVVQDAFGRVAPFTPDQVEAIAVMSQQLFALRMADIGFTHRQAGDAIQHEVHLCSSAAARREDLPGAEPRQSRRIVHVRSQPLCTASLSLGLSGRVRSPTPV